MISNIDNLSESQKEYRQLTQKASGASYIPISGPMYCRTPKKIIHVGGIICL
jgi:hypothetical protein